MKNSKYCIIQDSATYSQIEKELFHQKQNDLKLLNDFINYSGFKNFDVDDSEICGFDYFIIQSIKRYIDWKYDIKNRFEIVEVK